MKQWHPILTAREPEPGTWWLVDDDARPYAIVDVVRRHGEVGYRVTTWAESLGHRTLIGYWRKLMPAMTAAHDRIQRGTP